MQSRSNRHAILVAAVLVAPLLAGCMGTEPSKDANDSGSTREPTITIAITPTENAAAIQDKADELEAFLEARVPADVEIVVPLTYMGVVEALRFHHADVALMSAWPAVMAAQKADSEIVLAEKREVIVGTEPQVQPYYFSYFVVKKDSPFETIEDLRGKRVAFTSTASTSGYIFPVARLVQLGLVPAAVDGKQADPGAFFGEVRMAGGYQQAWAALESGQVDVAVVAGDVNVKLYDEVLAGTRVVETQGPVPSHAVVFSNGLAEPLRADLRDAFLELKGEHRELMRKLVSAIFVEFTTTTTEAHAAGLAQALELSGFRFEERL